MHDSEWADMKRVRETVSALILATPPGEFASGSEIRIGLGSEGRISMVWVPVPSEALERGG